MTNKIILHGRLARDIEMSYTSGDNSLAVARFTVAVSRQGKDKGVDFIPAVSFGKQAETLNNYFAKGSEIILTGRLQVNNYEDKEGKKRTSTNVIVEEFDFAGGSAKKENEDNNSFNYENEVNDDSLPF